jgi:hypothetical protein
METRRGKFLYSVIVKASRKELIVALLRGTEYSELDEEMKTYVNLVAGLVVEGFTKINEKAQASEGETKKADETQTPNGEEKKGPETPEVNSKETQETDTV